MRRSTLACSALLVSLSLSGGCFAPDRASQVDTDEGSAEGSQGSESGMSPTTATDSSAPTPGSSATSGPSSDTEPDDGSTGSDAESDTEPDDHSTTDVSGTTIDPSEGSSSGDGGSSGGGAEGSSSGGEVVVIDADLYVDAQMGDDDNDGSLDAPWATVTHAMSVVESGETVGVFPGLYDEAHGESFPIEVPAGVTLIGDPDDRGAGAQTTTISGTGVVEGDILAAIVPGVNTEIRGFTLVGATSLLSFGVFVETNALLAQNTYASSYGGVRLAGGDPRIERSTFETTSYGVYGCFGTGTIHDNHFVTPALNIDLQGTGPCTVSDNLIEGSGQLGIQNQGGDHVITGNTFDKPNGYTYGCILTRGASLIRNNVCDVDQGDAIRVLDGGSPNLGVPAEPGNNTLGHLNTVGVHALGAGSITARGNAWATPVPTCGVQIVSEGGANVWWGNGNTDFCGG